MSCSNEPPCDLLLCRPWDGTHSAKRDFGLGRGASEAHIRRDLPRARDKALGQKTLGPEGGLQFGFWRRCSSVTGPGRTCSLLAPRQKPNWRQQSVFHPTVCTVSPVTYFFGDWCDLMMF